VSTLLAILYAVSGVVAYACGWLLIGRQVGVLEAIGYSLIIALGTLPLLLASAAAGAATRSPTVGFIAGVLLYFASAFVAGLAAVLAVGLPSPEKLPEIQRLSVYATAANPFTAGASLARAVYAIVNHGGRMSIVVAYGGGASAATVSIDAYGVATVAALSLSASTALLALLLWLLVARRDL